MKFTLDKPAVVREAAAIKKGMNVFGEIGVFILVFLTVTLGEIILTEGRELINGGTFGLEGGLAVTVVVVIGILILFWRYPTVSETNPE